MCWFSTSANLVTNNIVGAIAEHYGDYRPAYLVLAAFVVVGVICVNLAYKISMDNRKKAQLRSERVSKPAAVSPVR